MDVEISHPYYTINCPILQVLIDIFTKIMYDIGIETMLRKQIYG